MVAPTSRSPTLACGNGEPSRDMTLTRPEFCELYEPYSVPPRGVGFCVGFAVTNSSLNSLDAPTTRALLSWTRMPSSDSNRSSAYVVGARVSGSRLPVGAYADGMVASSSTTGAGSGLPVEIVDHRGAVSSVIDWPPADEPPG